MKLLLWSILSLITLNSSCATGKKNYPNDTSTLTESVKNNKNIFYENKTFSSEWNLISPAESIMETAGMFRNYINSSVTFKKCVFKGNVNASLTEQTGKTTSIYFIKNVSFIDCIFEGDLNFRASVFSASCTFQGCSFLKGANFEECTFMQEAYFNETKYRDNGYFQNSVFMKKANWMSARFEANVSFQGAVFYNDAQLSNAEFQKYADFSVATFQMSCFFNYCVFGKQVVFNSSSFSKRMELVSTKIQKAEFRNCTFYLSPLFNEANVTEHIDFSKSIFFSGLPDLKSFSTLQLKGEDVRLGNTLLKETEFIKSAQLH
jgi:uncharacterized protein YjbI with pentapeptide repeats